jgi:LPS export ABC transporter protein LptC
VLSACKERPVAGPAPVLPNQVIESFTLNESHSGKRLYSLEADVACVYDGAQRVDVTSLRVTFFEDDGGVQSVLTAEEGSIYSKNEDLVARGNVVVRTADSTFLKTDSLAWGNTHRVVQTDAPVLIETPKGRIRGRGLISDGALSRIEIKSRVTGTSDYDFETGR